jgi:acetyltransferase-like isoleucine patch superfamily enzyme
MENQEIVIGDGVWFGARVTVLGGVTIGCGAIIAAGAVVNRSIPPFTIYGGVPAKKLKDRDVASSVLSPFGSFSFSNGRAVKISSAKSINDQLNDR